MHVAHDEMEECGAGEFAQKIPDGRDLESINAFKVHRWENITAFELRCFEFPNAQFLYVDCERQKREI